MAEAYQCSACGFLSNDFSLFQLSGAQMSCQLESAQYALFPVSITDTFLLTCGNGFETRPTNTLEWSLQTNHSHELIACA